MVWQGDDLNDYDVIKTTLYTYAIEVLFANGSLKYYEIKA